MTENKPISTIDFNPATCYTQKPLIHTNTQQLFRSYYWKVPVSTNNVLLLNSLQNMSLTTIKSAEEQAAPHVAGKFNQAARAKILHFSSAPFIVEPPAMSD